jgi:hypothetical protein
VTSSTCDRVLPVSDSVATRARPARTPSSSRPPEDARLKQATKAIELALQLGGAWRAAERMNEWNCRESKPGWKRRSRGPGEIRLGPRAWLFRGAKRSGAAGNRTMGGSGGAAARVR